MCRLLAYLGPETSLASLVLDPPFCLLRQSYAPRFQRRGRFNADGFGIGWYDAAVRPEPARYRRPTPLWSDRTFASLAPLVRAGAILASVRNATPPSPTEETSTPPYTSGPWLFAHNGEVAGFAEGERARLLEGVSEQRASGIEGTADSEVLFAMVLDRLDAGAAPAEALVGVVNTVLSGRGGRLNMVLTDGQRVAATSCGDSLYVRGPAGASKGFIVASEPFDDEPQWREVPDGSIVLSIGGEAPRIEAMSR
jgi:glutamine amidotransferase